MKRANLCMSVLLSLIISLFISIPSLTAAASESDINDMPMSEPTINSAPGPNRVISTNYSRGIKYVVYYQGNISWLYNSNGISNVDTWENVSGVGISAGGVQKVTSKSTAKKHYYNYTSHFTVGFSGNGWFNLGFTNTIVDQMWITNVPSVGLIADI
ncbi:MAG: hypothetical protein ACLSTT_05580 [Evtepia gabavorous]